MASSFSEFRVQICQAFSVVCLTFCFSSNAFSQDAVKIGRSQLTLPDVAQWNIAELDLPSVTYSGDVSGSIPLQTKRMQYRSVDGLIKGVITTSMTKSAVSAQMSWNNTCEKIKPSEHVYVKDNGSSVRLDCLVVIRAARLQPMSKSVDPKNILFGESIPHTLSGYYIQYSLGLSNGAQTVSYLLIAEGFQGLAGDSITNSSKIPDDIARWAIAFAKANNTALTSFSGDWALPKFNFN